jgi:3-oxoadipate enol-lactonase
MYTINNKISIYQSGEPQNKAILFIHGFPYDHNMWQKQIEELESSYHCITYDIRGLGASPAGNGQFTMESFVDDVEFIINEFKLDKPVLCGLSMGGYIAFRCMERMQDKFGGLIICDSKPEADNNEAKLRRAKGIKTINMEGVQKFVGDFVPGCFAQSSINNPKIPYNEVLNRSMKYDPVGVKGCLLAMLSRTDTSSYLSQIKIPTLIICGENDKLTPPEVMKLTSDRITNSEFIIVPEAGHMTPIENPKFVNKAITKFLMKHFPGI